MEASFNRRWTRESVDSFVTRFEQCRVSKNEWTHEAHLVVGFWYVLTRGRPAALSAMRSGIVRHNESVGTPNTATEGYHETITRLYLDGIVTFVAERPERSFEDQLAALLASPLGRSSWPLTRYSRSRLFSAQARRAWVEPDL
jgi:hypothetical protein